MRTKNLKLPYIFIFAFLAISSIANSIYAQSDNQGQIIKWKAINGITFYKFELEDSTGKSLVSENVDKNYYEIKLEVGKYRFRISALNKFNKIGRIYNWQTLEVKPVQPPVIKESPAVFNPKESGNTLEIKGEYLHRGTTVILKTPSGKTIQAKKEVLPDGSGIKIIMPENLEEGNYSLSIQNSIGKPIEQKVQLNSNVPTQISKVEVKSDSEDSYLTNNNSDNPFINSSRNKKTKFVVPMLWRSALVPGWGHEYAGKRNIASMYFYSSIVTGLYALNRYAVYNKNRDDYEEASRNYLITTLSGNSSLGNAIFFEQDISSKYNTTLNSRSQFNYSAQAFSIIYLTSLIHAIINGTQLEGSQTFQLNSTPEYFNNEMGTKYTVIYNFIY
ncbi:MAG: hypothetical protein CK427_00080 [Leptospira sp.]|nr:MAG: hypothetical protein CK427_00080 [Leptospira sp.]